MKQPPWFPPAVLGRDASRVLRIDYHRLFNALLREQSEEGGGTSHGPYETATPLNYMYARVASGASPSEVLALEVHDSNYALRTRYMLVSGIKNP